ncbi:MAG: hypothetical protein ACI909_003395 [Planctomycetota bacterium]|jgi:hypothetical protein
MKNTTESKAYTVKEVSLTLNETYPESTYGAVPTLDPYDTVDMYSPFDEVDLGAVPGVLDAYLDHHQRQWL